MLNAIPLELMQSARSGVVLEVSGPPEWRDRLIEMGVREGVVLGMVKPGSPCVVTLEGHRLCLRCPPGAMILVEEQPAPAACSLPTMGYC